MMTPAKRCAFLTMENLAGFVCYDSLTYEPLRELGWTVDEVPWDRSGVSWPEYQAVVIRSPWDYQRRPELFLEVLETIETSGVPLFNSLEYCRWNMDKHYLQDLSRKGVPILPTLWPKTIDLAQLDRWLDELQTKRIVIKPTIGANADDTFILSADQPELLEQVRQIYQAKSFLVQPFVESIQTEGEYSLFYFGGEFSHAINKLPKSGDFRVQEEHGGQIHAIIASDRLRLAGQHVIDQLGQKLLYARVDLVDWQGTPALMEVELIEPSLYFAYAEGSARMFATALDRMLFRPRMPDKLLGRKI